MDDLIEENMGLVADIVKNSNPKTIPNVKT